MRIFRVFAPFGNAIDLTIRKLFKPFNLAFYLKLAFIAWLANLGQCSGGFNFPIDGNDLKTFLNSFRQEQPSFQNDPVLKTADGNATYEKVTFEDKKETERISVKVEEGKTEVTTPAQNENPPQSVSISSTKDGKPVFLFILALCIAVLWVISRGRMMFISALADDTQRLSLREKWRESRITGNSLFKYNITVVVLSLLFVLIFCPALYFLLHPVTKTWIAAPSAPIAPAPAIIALLLTFCIAIPFGFVLGAFHEFGTLLMFRQYLAGSEILYFHDFRLTRNWSLPDFAFHRHMLPLLSVDRGSLAALSVGCRIPAAPGSPAVFCHGICKTVRRRL